MPDDKDRPNRRFIVISVVAFVAFVVAAIIGGFVLHWQASRIGALATWVSGAATFTAAAAALYQAHRAQIEAYSAKVSARTTEWETELHRRTDREMDRRREGMQLCMQVIGVFSEARLLLANAVRVAAFGFDDHEARRDSAYAVDIHCRKAAAEVGVLTLPIRRSRFAHQVADVVLPAIQKVFDQCHKISEAETTDELLEYLDNSGAPFDLVDPLQNLILEEFAPDMDKVTEQIEAEMPPKPE